MIVPEQKSMTITVEIPSGRFIKVEGQDVQSHPADVAKLQGIHHTDEGFKYVCSILYRHSSPRCFYYYLPNGECTEICF